MSRFPTICASRVLLAIVCAMPLASAVTVTEIRREQQRVHPSELEQILAQPAASLNTRVKFRAVFAGIGDLFNPRESTFRPELHVNFALWDDRARLWDAGARSRPVLTLYVKKDERLAAKLPTFHKYQVVDVVARVVQITDAPWFEVSDITPVPDAGAFSDRAIYHLEQAEVLAAATPPARDLADGHFAAALKEGLPIGAAIDVRELRARNQLAGGHADAAVVTLTEALKALADAQLDDVGLTARLHALLAKAHSDLADAATGEARTTALNAAIAQARTALESDPSLSEAYAVLGIALSGTGAFDEARRQCDIAIRLRPNDAEVRWYLGRILDQQGRHDEAIAALKKAIDLTPTDPRLHQAIASAYLHRGVKTGANGGADLDLALREFDTTQRLKPGNVEAAFQSGVATEAAAAIGAEVTLPAGKQPATTVLAIERYRSALTLDAKHLPSHLALVGLLKSQPDALREELARMSAAAPDDLGRVTDLADVALTQGKPEVGTAAYDRFLAVHPADPAALVAYGRFLAAVGDNGRAAQLATQLAKLHDDQPRNAAITVALGEQKLALGDLKTAEDLALAGAKRAQGETETTAATVLLGKIRYAQDNVAETVRLLAPLAERLQDARAAAALAWCYLAQGRPADANPLIFRAGLAPDAVELKGWQAYLNADYAGAETLLKTAPIGDDKVKAYRLGMTIYQQGPARYADAKPLLESAKGVNGRASLFAKANADLDSALAVINAAVPSSVPAVP